MVQNKCLSPSQNLSCELRFKQNRNMGRLQNQLLLPSTPCNAQ